jgi:hypothetical protein
MRKGRISDGLLVYYQRQVMIIKQLYMFTVFVPTLHLFWICKTFCLHVRFQVLTAASMKFRIVFWDVLPCKIIVDRRFRGTCCLHIPLKRRSTIILHGSTSQKTIMNFILFT